jgi:hypothetical protein
MAKILVLAKSGFGKTTSYAGREKYGIKGLDPKTTFVVQCIGRGVPNPDFRLAPEPEIKYIAQYNRVQVYTITGRERFKRVAYFIQSFKNPKNPYKNLVIDDFKFSYLEGRNQLEFNFKVQDTSYNGQLAKRYIHEGWTTFFGKEFKASSNALLYQKSTSRASSGDFTQNENIKSIKSVRLNTVPVPYLTSPRFVYGGKPKRVKGRY